MAESKKDDITLEDLMGLPPADKDVETEDEAENESEDREEESSNEELKELQDVVNSEPKEDDLDAGLVEDDEDPSEESSEEAQEEDPKTKSYEDQENDKKLNENINARAEEQKAEDDKNMDENADLKQKVVGVIKRFKGEAQSIEEMREVSPEAYAATLEVINTMLELARALGLCGGDDEESTTIVEGINSPGEDELGKSMILPTKRTTRHIPKSRRPVGSVDNKGREKTIDEEGNFSWVDRKEGVVKDLKGKIGRREDGR